MRPISALVSQYACALREEPKLRAFALASFVDDIGVAIAAWATMLMMTNLFTTQRARASLMLPSLVAFLLGTVVSGPLADWADRDVARLARWRWRLVVWARLVETAMIGVLLLELRSGAPSVARILPFAILTAFTKTAFRPTRNAFSVDLLSRSTVQTDAAGNILRDERGQPLEWKTHLFAMTSLIGALAAAATLVGLLLGGRILDFAGHNYAPLFAAQAAMHLLFVGVIFFGCHPSLTARAVRVRDLVGDARDAVSAPPRLSILGGVSHFGTSIKEGARFLAEKQQRSLLILLIGTALVELVTESYDGKMIVKHVLAGGDEAVRHAEIGWSIVGVLGVAALPALTRFLGGIGRIFLATMLIDGVVIVLAGRIAGMGAASAIVPFTLAIAVDNGLTLATNGLADLATNSASSAAMRGRIAAAYAFVVIIGDMAVEAIATPVSEAIGIPAMMARVGILQVVIVAGLAAWGGRRLWQFGLRDAGAPEPTLEATASSGAVAPSPAAQY
jgi:MFS family permease